MEEAPAITLSKTKIIVPRRSGNLLTRPRLLDLMADLLEKKLILLSAPAGYGKTSLLIDLADHAELPFCWLALDPLDRDPQRFLAYLIGALAECFPSVGKQPQSLLNQLKSLEQDAETILVSLTNELYEEVDQHFILAIDDYHLVDEIPAISALVNRFIQLADENCHVILSARIPPNLPELTLLVARNQVDGLSHIDLAFDAEEIQALFAQNHRQHITQEAARELVEQTSGWITGLQLSGLGRPAAAERLRVARASGIDLFAYLGRQVLDQQTTDLRVFLLQTSLMDEFNVELCEYVLGPLHPGRVDWPTHINLIRERSLFTLPLGPDGLWLRYHPLFREFLQARLREDRPAEIRPILENLTQYYEYHGEWEKAYQACQQLQDPTALADLVERVGTPMAQHAMLTVESWLQGLPPGLLRTRPGLVSLQGLIALAKGKAQEGIELLSQAQEAFRKEKNISGLALALVRRAVTYRYRGEYSASIRDVDEVLQLTETTESLHTEYAEALRLKGLCLYRLGKSRQAVEFLERALVMYTSLKRAHEAALLQMETGMVYRALGEVDAAKASYEKSLKIWRAEGNLYWQANLLNSLGVLFHMQGKYEEAVLVLEEGLQDAHQSANTRVEALLLASLGDVYTDVAEFETAGQTYQHAGEIAAALGDRFISNYLALARVQLALRAGDLAGARSLLKNAESTVQADESNYERGLLNLARGQILLTKDKPAKAVAALEQAENCFVQDGRELENMTSRVWLSAALFQSGRKAAAREKLMSALASFKQVSHSLTIALHQIGPWLQGMQTDLEIRRALKGYASLIQQVGTFEEGLPSIRRRLRRLSRQVEAPAPGLMIQAFGPAQVKVGGRLLTMSDWLTQSVRDLFFFFFTAERSFTKEEVAEALWPEVDDPGRLKLRFKNEMYRLRRAVGKNVILFEEEYYHFNHALDYEYDVEAFETHLAQARASTDPERRIQHYVRAVTLVQGPYLDDMDLRSAPAERERLAQDFLLALDELGELYLQTKKPEKTLAVCQRALSEDPARESTHQLAMRTYAILGDRSAIVRQYKACERALKGEFNLPPSDETGRLYRQLTAGHA